MAVPVVTGTTGYDGPVAATSWTPFTNLAVVAGEFLVFICEYDGTPTLSTASTGWSKFATQGNGASWGQAIFYKLITANGLETLAISSTAAENYTGILYRITGADSLTANFTSGVAPNPANSLSLNAGMIRDRLWITTRGHQIGGSAGIATTAPGGYTGLTTQAAAGATAASSSIQAAHKTATASQTEDPGAFGEPQTHDWVAATISIWLSQQNIATAIDAGSYALTGSAIGLARARKTAIVAGAYAVTGSAIGLVRARKTAIVAGVYALTGSAITFLRGKVTTITAGLYALSGAAITLSAARRIAVAAGQYLIGGKSLSYSNSYRFSGGTIAQMTQDAGISGFATVTTAPPGDPLGVTWYDLNNSSGTAYLYADIDMVGVPIGTAVTVSMLVYQDNGVAPAEGSGNDKDFFWTAALSGTFSQPSAGFIRLTDNIWRYHRTYIATSAGARLTRAGPVRYPAQNVLARKFGAFQLNEGQQPLPFVPSNGTPGAGSTVTGSDIALLRAKRLPIVAGSYVLTGSVIALKRQYRTAIAAGAYVLTGFAVVLLHARRIAIVAGQYLLTGLDLVLKLFRPVATPAERRISMRETGSRRTSITSEGQSGRRMDLIED